MSEILTSSTTGDFNIIALKKEIDAEEIGFSEVAQKLIRGEISAIETYDQVTEKFSGKCESSSLNLIRDEHVSALSTLKQFAEGYGATPENSSGAWGSWAQFTTGAAKLFGDATAIKALIEGEEHGLKDYQGAVDDVATEIKLREEIQNRLIPQQIIHITELKKLIEMQ